MQTLDVRKRTSLTRMSQIPTVALMPDDSSDSPPLDAERQSLIERHAQIRARFIDPEQRGGDDGPREGPHDCVLLSPSVTPEATQLVAFDGEGRPRAILILPTEIVTEDDERWLLDRIRVSRTKGDPRPVRLIG